MSGAPTSTRRRWAISIYLLGAVSAFLATTLALSDAQAGLHSSAMATGLIGAGLVGHRLDDRFGSRAVHLGALTILGLATMLIAWSPGFDVTLAGALAMGAGCGLLLSHVNAAVSAVGGVRALVQFTRSTLISMLSSVTVPVVIGMGIAIGVGWQLAVMPALLLIAVAALASWGRVRQANGSTVSRGSLPRSFRLPWLLVVLVVCIEFGVLYWAATMVERSTGASLADATLTISVFIGGVVLARTAVSIPAVGRVDPIVLLRISLALALLGSLRGVGLDQLRAQRGGDAARWRRPRRPVPGLCLGDPGYGARPASAGFRPGGAGIRRRRCWWHPSCSVSRPRSAASSPPGSSSRRSASPRCS